MTRFRIAFAALLASAALPALAADPTLDQRVDRVEKQLKAVQRKVFPGGDAAFQAPEITAPEVHSTAGLPASTPLNDLTARVDALEKSVAQMTGQIEQDEHRLDLLSQQSAQDRQEFATRLKLLETAAAPPPAATPVQDEPAEPAPIKPAPAKGKPEPVVAPAKGPAVGAAKPATAKPAPTKADAATADTTPATAANDPAEAAYMDGYNLWSQKKYPQAEAALAATVKKYPKHRRASYAQNLLGRAYMDEGKTDEAAQAFYDSYKKFPSGERAPDSLYYLGQLLMKMNRATDACRIYDQLRDSYGDTIDAALKPKIAAARKTAKCS